MNVGRIASVYRWIEYAAFGRALEHARLYWLRSVQGAKRILILGEGDGRFLSPLLSLNPGAAVNVIELSPEMIALARQRIPETANIQFHQADARKQLPAGGPYDLIVTHFFLDCFSETEAAALIGAITKLLAPQGVWLVTEFYEPPKGLRRVHARIWLWAMYLFFRLGANLQPHALPGYAGILRRNGLILAAEHTTRFGLIVSQIWRKPD